MLQNSGMFQVKVQLHSYLLKQVHGSFWVLVQQVVKHKQDAGQVEGYSLKLRIRLGCDFSDGLHAEGEDAASAFFREVMKDEQKQLKVFNVEVLVSRYCSL